MRHSPVTFGRLAVIVAAAFLFGGASAEVAVRTHRAVERVRTEREIGAAGQLVALQITGAQGEVLARPRLIAPRGKAASLVLHDPGLGGAVRLSFRVEADREPTGEIELAYELKIPGQALSASGKVSLTPGVEQSMHARRWRAGRDVARHAGPLGAVRRLPRVRGGSAPERYEDVVGASFGRQATSPALASGAHFRRRPPVHPPVQRPARRLTVPSPDPE